MIIFRIYILQKLFQETPEIQKQLLPVLRYLLGNNWLMFAVTPATAAARLTLQFVTCTPAVVAGGPSVVVVILPSDGNV